MKIGLSTFKHLLPDARAWRLTIDKQLRQFFQGLSGPMEDAQDYQDAVWNDYRPFETTKLPEWEQQWGLSGNGTDAERRAILDATWKATGGQSPRYIQDTVQAAGFPLFIHEWWEDGTDPPVARDPRLYISPTGTGATVDVQLGHPDSQLGHPLAYLGRGRQLGYLVINNLAPPIKLPNDTDKWPFFVYFGAETWPDKVSIPASRRLELETLLLKLCPGHLWIGLLVEFT